MDAKNFSAPKNWALAVALQQQIADYKTSAKILTMADEELAGEDIFGEIDVAALRAAAVERVKRPVVDIDAAMKLTSAIEAQGGWGQFVRPIGGAE